MLFRSPPIHQTVLSDDALIEKVIQSHMKRDLSRYVQPLEMSPMAIRLEPLESNWMARQVRRIERLRMKKRIHGIH